jgi:hypothetical protein
MATYSQIVNNRDANRTQNFTYDALNRIQTACSSRPNWGESFGNATAPGGVPSTPGNRCLGKPMALLGNSF